MKSQTAVEPIGDVSPQRVLRAISEMDHPFAFSEWRYGSARYTFAGAAPFITMTTRADGVTSVRRNVRSSQAPAQPVKLPESSKDPLEIISDIIEEFGSPAPGPFPFNGGMVGYFGYDMKEHLSKEARSSPAKLAPDRALSLPCCVGSFYDTIYVYDHAESEAFIVTTGSGREGGFKLRLRDAMLREPSGQKTKEAGGQSYKARTPAEGYTGPLRSNTTRAEHIAAIERALEYIGAGDIYQINLSHRLELEWAADPLELYLSLLKDSPAPFSSYMDLGNFRLISNSPERLLRVSGDTVETGPIKGTRPRGMTPDEDAALIKELGEDAKERAEHVMIVDLERNDLGRSLQPRKRQGNGLREDRDARRAPPHGLYRKRHASPRGNLHRLPARGLPRRLHNRGPEDTRDGDNRGARKEPPNDIHRRHRLDRLELRDGHLHGDKDRRA